MRGEGLDRVHGSSRRFRGRRFSTLDGMGVSLGTDPKALLREKAEDLINNIFLFHVDSEGGLDDKEPVIDALESFAREAVLQLCEGEHCYVARCEQEAYQKGRKEGIEEAAEIVKQWTLSSPEKEIKDNLTRLENQLLAMEPKQ